MKKILFITWDGPQTNYMEGLFMPIFDEIQKKSYFKFYIVQFTWASETQSNLVKKNAEKLGIHYINKPILRRPNATIGSAFSILKGIVFLNNYIKKNKIEIVIPRSTIPALIVNNLKKQNFKILFDADGLPLEERVDFAYLSRDNWQYKFLKKQETKILNTAEAVITRSKKAIEIHLNAIGNKNSEKFSVVTNGRNEAFFKPNPNERNEIRNSLKIEKNDKVFIYCGSLGNQYGWSEMISIFEKCKEKNSNSKFIILTGNIEYAAENLPIEMKKEIILKKVHFQEIPKYLSAADIAFAIRTPKFSMQGVAPIKLGEYLLMGIPTIASLGIGDTDEILKHIPFCFGFDHQSNNNIDEAVLFVQNLVEIDIEKIRNAAIPFFSIENSAIRYIKALEKVMIN